MVYEKTVEISYSAHRTNKASIKKELTSEITCLSGVEKITFKNVDCSEDVSVIMHIEFAPHVNNVGTALIEQTVEEFPYIESVKEIGE